VRLDSLIAVWSAEGDRFETVAPVDGLDLGQCAHIDRGSRIDLLDQVLGHRFRQAFASVENRDLARVLREVERCLAGGVRAANNEHLFVGTGRRLAASGSVVRTSAG
jgi:hypothetical protein